MKLLLILSIATLALCQEAYEAHKGEESNDVPQGTTVLQVQPESEVQSGDKKLEKRSHGWYGHGWGGWGHGWGHGWPIYSAGWHGHGHGHGWSGGWGGHGWYGGWYPGWPWYGGHGWHGGHGGWHGGHGGWHGKW